MEYLTGLGNWFLTTLFSTTGYLLYWTPLALCLIGYVFKWLDLYQEDQKNLIRENIDYHARLKTWNEQTKEQRRHRNPPQLVFHPKLRVGTIVGNIVLSLIPIVNIFVLVFDAMFSIFSNVMRVCGKWFKTPFVKARVIPEEQLPDANV